MKISVLQHSDGTPPGTVSEWAALRGHSLTLHRLHLGEALPDLDKCDLVVILGGPMNVDDLDLYPWLADEKKFLKDAVTEGLPCVGLCLGGQLLAQTLGAKVRKNKHWEVGWHSVRLTDGAELKVFQWHQDCFELPKGTERLATNSITETQGFTIGKKVLAVQFHPESTLEWVEECSLDDDYPNGPFVQSPNEVMAGAVHLAAMRRWFFDQLDSITRL